MSLVELAERKMLPEFQSMDQYTLDWIRAHRPSLPSWDYRKELFTYPFPRAGSPIADAWFLEPKTMSGIHGTRHALRVGMYAYALAKTIGFSIVTCNTIALAGLLHDVRRKDDKTDIEHGSRCAEWFRDNHPIIGFAQHVTDVERSMISVAIKLHDLPHDKIVYMAEYVECSDIVDILRTADALDRYRLPKLKWWVDDSYLNRKPNDEFKAFSFELIVASEQYFLDGEDNATAVVRAFEHLMS